MLSFRAVSFIAFVGNAPRSLGSRAAFLDLYQEILAAHRLSVPRPNADWERSHKCVCAGTHDLNGIGAGSAIMLILQCAELRRWSLTHTLSEPVIS